MDTLKELTANAVKAYPKANMDTKQLLEDLFGKKTFIQNICDQIEGWEDILEISGRDASEFELRPGETDDELAYREAKLLAFVYNGCKLLDAGDTSQNKYSVWHKIVKDASKPSGFGLAYDDCDDWSSGSIVGVRLCFADPNHAIDANKKFPEIYERLKIR